MSLFEKVCEETARVMSEVNRHRLEGGGKFEIEMSPEDWNEFRYTMLVNQIGMIDLRSRQIRLMGNLVTIRPSKPGGITIFHDGKPYTTVLTDKPNQ